MGLFSKRIKNPVRGSAQVISCSGPPHQSGGGGMCRMNLVITVPNQAALPVEHQQIVMLSHWPWPGTVLPIEAEQDNPQRFRILWDEVPSGRQRSAARAEQVAARINTPQPPPAQQPTMDGAGISGLLGSFLGGAGGAGPAFVTSSSVSINGQPATPDQIAQFEALTGMDLNGDGAVAQSATAGGPTGTVSSGAELAAKLRAVAHAGEAAAGAPGGGAAHDRVGALERLAALRDSGALTPAASESPFPAADRCRRARPVGSGERTSDLGGVGVGR